MKLKSLLLLLCFAAAAQADTTTVQGSTFGTWSAAGNPYLLVGNIDVPFGRTLTIEPGVLMECFGGAHSISVYGELVAEGTAELPITFTVDTVLWSSRWNGIRLASGSATLRHCIIENATNTSVGEQVGSALNCQQGTLVMSDCLIQHCQSRPPVGVYNSSEAYLERCTVRYNQLSFGCCGGAIGVRGDSHLELVDCYIHNNSALDGGGVYVNDGSTANIEGCLITDNVAQIWGGGIFTGGGGAITIKRTQVLDNTSEGSGGGIEAHSYNLSVERCNFVGNSGRDGQHVHTDTSPVTFNSCIFAPFNGPFGGRESLYLTPSATIRYCTIFSYFTDVDFAGELPDSLGFVAFMNANGDSCDAYFNVYSNPEFVNSGQDDWNLLPDSPCIDAGDPQLPLDPDGTVAEMGAFYFSQTPVSDQREAELPDSPVLHPAHPNPFNPATTISFTLEKPTRVSLRIIDLLGRTTDVLADGLARSGLHNYHWQPQNLPSGIYFAELRAGGYSAVQKLVLLK